MRSLETPSCIRILLSAVLSVADLAEVQKGSAQVRLTCRVSVSRQPRSSRRILKTIEFEENSPPYQQGFECQASAAASQQSSFSSCKGALENQLSIKQKENFAFAHAVVIDMSMIRKQMSMTT